MLMDFNFTTCGRYNPFLRCLMQIYQNSIYLLSIKEKKKRAKKPNNSLLITAHSQTRGDESCLYPLKMNNSPAGKSAECLSKLDIVRLPDSILFLCTADYRSYSLLLVCGWLPFLKDLQELFATQSCIIVYLPFTDPYFPYQGVTEVREVMRNLLYFFINVSLTARHMPLYFSHVFCRNKLCHRTVTVVKRSVSKSVMPKLNKGDLQLFISLF